MVMMDEKSLTFLEANRIEMTMTVNVEPFHSCHMDKLLPDRQDNNNGTNRITKMAKTG